MTTNPPHEINLQKIVRPYSKPDSKASWFQVLNTLVPLFLCYTVAFWLFEIHWGLSIPFCLLGSLFTVRTFIIMHDCGHGSFFQNRRLRDALGVLTGILTFTPYRQWTREHAAHHKHSGNLDYRGRGDVWTMTLKEYQAASWIEKLQYRLYRNPLVTFGIGPVFIFQFRHRISIPTDRKIEKNNLWFTNISLGLILTGLYFLLGWKSVLFVIGVTSGVAQIIGCLLFYVQHQYEEVYWDQGGTWDYNTAALDGCSYLKLPKIFQWFTGNIGFHHIHHLNHKIPNYNLEQCHKENGIFQNSITLTMKDMIGCVNLKIYDEEAKKMLTWKQVEAIA